MAKHRVSSARTAKEESEYDIRGRATKALGTAAYDVQVLGTPAANSFVLKFASYNSIGYKEIKALSVEFSTEDLKIGSEIVESGGCDTCSSTSAETTIQISNWT